MGKAFVLLISVLVGFGCKSVNPNASAVLVAPADKELFKMEIRTTPPKNCCVCVSDSAFDNIDLKNPENYCTEYFKKYENFCDALIIGPRYVSLHDVKTAVIAELGENACHGHLFYQTHGHSGSTTIASGPVEQIRLCKEANCLPEKVTLITTGCQAHKYPDRVEEVLLKLAEETGIKHIESHGNQAYDPGPAGLDWTMSKVAIINGVAQHDYWPCKDLGTNCTMLGSYHHNMGWRCKAPDGSLKAQFCCPSATREDKWDWNTPVDYDEAFGLPPHNCEEPSDPAVEEQ